MMMTLVRVDSSDAAECSMATMLPRCVASVRGGPVIVMTTSIS